VRSRALNRAFNRALIDPTYRRELLADLRRVLRAAGVPDEEIDRLESSAPRDIYELARSLETMHTSSFQRKG